VIDQHIHLHSGNVVLPLGLSQESRSSEGDGQVTMSHGSAFVSPPSLSGRDHIQHAIWLYLRFTLSYRDVEELLAERGLDVSYETVRRRVLKFAGREGSHHGRRAASRSRRPLCCPQKLGTKRQIRIAATTQAIDPASFKQENRAARPTSAGIGAKNCWNIKRTPSSVWMRRAWRCQKSGATPSDSVTAEGVPVRSH